MDLLKEFLKRGQYVVPKNTIRVALFSNFAYWICLFVGLFGIIMLICGFKKGGKLTILSTVIYWIIAALCSI